MPRVSDCVGLGLVSSQGILMCTGEALRRESFLFNCGVTSTHLTTQANPARPKRSPFLCQEQNLRVRSQLRADTQLQGYQGAALCLKGGVLPCSVRKEWPLLP